MEDDDMESITEGQVDQYKRFVEVAANQARKECDLNKDSLQILLENGGEFQRDIIASIKKHSKKNLSLGSYFSGYKPGSRSVREQINILKRLIPNLKADPDVNDLGPLPRKAEGYFVYPRPEVFGADFGPNYSLGIKAVLNLFSKISINDFAGNRFIESYISNIYQNSSSNHTWRKIAEQQNYGDILIVPAQFGLYYRGLSADDTRKIMSVNEFELGFYAAAVMLLTHPERLNHEKDLEINCIGDYIILDNDVNFPKIPGIRLESNGKLGISAPEKFLKFDWFGQVTGFLPRAIK